jgi:hypothetical protein
MAYSLSYGVAKRADSESQPLNVDQNYHRGAPDSPYIGIGTAGLASGGDSKVLTSVLLGRKEKSYRREMPGGFRLYQ